MLARGGRAKRVNQPWSRAENALICGLYQTAGVTALLPLLPRRNVATIRKQAQKLGVTTRALWSPAEEKRFTGWWQAGHSIEWMAAKLKRSPNALYVKATKLGILGVPQGYETLTKATRRTGFTSVPRMKALLRWAGVRMHLSRTFPRACHKGLYKTHFVDPFDVDEAVRRWLRLETVAYAAESRGIPHSTLYQWLVEDGVVHKVSGPCRRHHRFEAEVIDRVVAERRQQPVRAAA